MEVIVDRYEGDFAICEQLNREMIVIRKEMLPDGVTEGDVLDISEDRITINPEKRKAREERINDLTNYL